jgi:hypothetical protein
MNEQNGKKNMTGKQNKHVFNLSLWINFFSNVVYKYNQRMIEKSKNSVFFSEKFIA